MVFDDFLELKGDRKSGDDNMVLAGLARIGDQKLITIGYQGEKDSGEIRLPSPEGYYKSMRLISLAEAFKKPLVVIIDIPEFHATFAPIQQKIDESLAKVQELMLNLNIPIIAIILGTDNSAFSFDFCSADRILIPDWSTFTIQSKLSESQNLKSQELLKLNLIDRIVEYKSDDNLASVKGIWQAIIKDEFQNLSHINSEALLDQRFNKLQERFFSLKSVMSKVN